METLHRTWRRVTLASRSGNLRFARCDTLKVATAAPWINRAGSHHRGHGGTRSLLLHTSFPDSVALRVLGGESQMDSRRPRPKGVQSFSPHDARWHANLTESGATCPLARLFRATVGALNDENRSLFRIPFEGGFVTKGCLTLSSAWGLSQTGVRGWCWKALRGRRLALTRGKCRVINRGGVRSSKSGRGDVER